ncbi:hypothetical protein SUGI_1101240 [Cryptomeria japonica]|nr:hypothetical protein SUGI_1101240 [Cryptomeria japonica]
MIKICHFTWLFSGKRPAAAGNDPQGFGQNFRKLGVWKVADHSTCLQESLFSWPSSDLRVISKIYHC